MKAFLVFIAELLHVRPDFFIHEIVDTVPPAFLENYVAPLYNVITGIDNPPDRGFPTKRPRRYSCGYNADRMLFEGSYEEFDELFTRTTVLTGDAYLLAPPEERIASIRKNAPRLGGGIC